MEMTKAVKEKFRKLPPSPSVINFLKRKKEKLWYTQSDKVQYPGENNYAVSYKMVEEPFPNILKHIFECKKEDNPPLFFYKFTGDELSASTLIEVRGDCQFKRDYAFISPLIGLDNDGVTPIRFEQII